MNCDVISLNIDNPLTSKVSVDILNANKVNVNNIINYGYLYNWYAASDPNLAPDGWRIATVADYDQLFLYLGATKTVIGPTQAEYSIVGNLLKETGTDHWDSPNAGVNSTKFNAVGGGSKKYGAFSNLKRQGNYWCEDLGVPPANAGRFASFDYNTSKASLLNELKGFGYSIRLIKNTSDYSEGETVTDFDGNIYPVTKIGNQVWLASNWACTTLSDGTPMDTNFDAAVSAAYCSYNDDTSNVFNDNDAIITVLDTWNNVSELSNYLKTTKILVNKITYQCSNAAQLNNVINQVEQTIDGQKTQYKINLNNYIDPVNPNLTVHVVLSQPILIDLNNFFNMDIEAETSVDLLFEYCEFYLSADLLEIPGYVIPGDNNLNVEEIDLNKDKKKIVIVKKTSFINSNWFWIVAVVAAIWVYKKYRK